MPAHPDPHVHAPAGPSKEDLFVFDPRYAPFARGHTQSLPSPGPPFILLVMACMLAIGVFLFWSPLADQQRRAALASGVTTQAQVTARTQERTDMGHGSFVTTHYLSYQYTAPGPNGTSHTYQNRVEMVSDLGPDRGATITIRYLPSDPSQSVYIGEPPSDGLGSLLEMLVGLGLAALSGGVLASVLWNWSRLRRLQRGGALVHGRIEAVGPVRQGYRSVSAPAAIAFRSPTTGQTVESTVTARALSEAHLPVAGAHVAVLYQTDTQFQVL